MIHPDTVDQALGQPSGDLGVGSVENRRVLLTKSGQRRDGEEPAVAADAVTPAGQPVVLPVVHHRSGCPVVGGSRGEGEGHGVTAQCAAVHQQGSAVVVAAQHRQQDASLGIGRPVDVEEPGIRRGAAVRQDVPPPGIVMGLVDGEVVGHDVDDQAHAAGAGGAGQRCQSFGAAQGGRYGCRVGDVVAVFGAWYGGEHRRQIQMTDAQIVQIVDQPFGITEGENSSRPTACSTAQLQSVGGQHRLRHGCRVPARRIFEARRRRVRPP